MAPEAAKARPSGCGDVQELGSWATPLSGDVNIGTVENPGVELSNTWRLTGLELSLASSASGYIPPFPSPCLVLQSDRHSRLSSQWPILQRPTSATSSILRMAEPRPTRGRLWAPLSSRRARSFISPRQQLILEVSFYRVSMGEDAEFGRPPEHGNMAEVDCACGDLHL